MATISASEASKGAKQENEPGVCEGSEANINCEVSAGVPSVMCTGVTLAEASSKGWRRGRCVKISVVSHNIQNEVQYMRDDGSFRPI